MTDVSKHSRNIHIIGGEGKDTQSVKYIFCFINVRNVLNQNNHTKGNSGKNNFSVIGEKLLNMQLFTDLCA